MVVMFSTLEGFISTGYILNGSENQQEEQQQVTSNKLWRKNSSILYPRKKNQLEATSIDDT